MNPLWKHIPNAVTQIAGRTMLKTSKHSPTILFVGGIVGVVATTVMASRATLKLNDSLEETRENLEKARSLAHRNVRYQDEDYSQDLVIIYSKAAVTVTKLYAPAVIVGFVSIAALTKSHRILTGRNAALTAAYAALEKGFAEYRKRVVQEFGEETDQRMRHGYDYIPLTGPIYDENGNPQELMRKNPNHYSIYARFFDQTCRNYEEDPSYNMFFLRAQQQFANDILLSRGHIFLNEVYDMIGLERSRAGQVVGWVVSKEGDNFVDFGIFAQDKERARAFVNGYEPAILLDFNVDGVIYDKI